MNWIREELFNWRLNEKFKFLMVFVVNPFSKIDEIRYCSWLLFNWGFFIMIVD